MEQFLKTIWGSYESGYRCIITGADRPVKHEFRELDFEAVELAASKKKTNVWYAPAILSTEERKIANVVAVKSFWLDIDIKPEKAGAYHTLVDAIHDLSEFVKSFDLPMPTIINSGNGLHVYWILSSHVSPAQWHRIAGALREACVAHALKADHGITIDIARILRVPDTKNYKDKSNPKPVELLTGIDTCEYEELESALGEYINTTDSRQSAAKANSIFSVDLPQTPKDAEQIANTCSQMAAFRDTKGNISEPEWYAGLGVLALCVDGDRIANEWSSGHPSYSVEATTDKFQRAKDYAPTTCAKFNEVNPSLCEKCPFFGKITTPLQLGETVTEIEKPKVAIAVEGQTELVERDIPMPKNFVVGEEGVYLLVPGDDDNPPERQIIFTQPVWVSRVMIGEAGAGSEVELSWINSNGQTKSACFRQSLLAIDSQFAGWLLDQNVHGYLQIKSVIPYIRAGIATVAKAFGEQTVYSKFGLNDAGFLIGTDLITKTRKETARISGSIDAKRVKLMDAKGTLEAWSEVTGLLDRPNWWMHRFAVLAGLSAPLFVLSGSQGSILSLAGESSGGKTTSANLGVSAYGDPRAFTVDPKSTPKAFYEHWRQLGNLPLIVNEAGTIPRENKILSDLVYAAANGKARDRLRIDGSMNNSGEWSTLTIFTSNVHLMSMSDRVLGEAERRRVLELTFNRENLMDIDTGRAISDCVRVNHGVAGRIFIEYILRNREEVARAVQEKVDILQTGVDSVHRFSIWQIAVNCVVGKVATDLGLIRFGYDDAIRHAVISLKNQVGILLDPVERVEELIAEWTTIYQQGIGIKEVSNKTAWHREPHGEARGLWNARGQTMVELCVPTKQFKAYALENSVDVNHIREFVAARNVTTKQVRLSQQSNPVLCYVIPQREEEQ
jgi:hypothetical protein